MFIKQLTINNFRSFSNLDLHLGNLNILVGANASGKSNFIKILQFLRNIQNHGLDNAISMEGGVEYLRNTHIGSNEPLEIKLVYKPTNKLDSTFNMYTNIQSKIHTIIYEFSIKFHKRGKGFKIVKDKTTLQSKFFQAKTNETKQIGLGQGILEVHKGQITSNFDLPANLNIKPEFFFPFSIELREIDPKTLFLETPLFSLIHVAYSNLENIAIYDLDPKLSKKAVSIIGKTELEEDGSNLSIVLKNIIANKNKKRQFLNLMQDLLPFIGDLKVQKFADRSLLFTLSEIFNEQSPYLPASFLSDGTANIIALLIALYFENKPLIVIEEAERNLHPHLISKIMAMFDEVSAKKQIILTTHNPEIVKHANINNLLLVSRDEQGFSTISKPAQQQEIQAFLENEIGIDELYVQNLLEIGHAA